MGIFGMKKRTPPPHPRREPRFECPLTADGIAGVFERCADFNRRTLYLNNDPARQVEMLFIAGQVRNERACDYVLRPLTQNEALRAAPDMDAAFDLCVLPQKGTGKEAGAAYLYAILFYPRRLYFFQSVAAGGRYACID